MESRENQTIAAVSTAPGQGGISIIRISGPEAIEIADRIFVFGRKNIVKGQGDPSQPLQTRRKKPGKRLADQPGFTVHYGYIADRKNSGNYSVNHSINTSDNISGSVSGNLSTSLSENVSGSISGQFSDNMSLTNSFEIVDEVLVTLMRAPHSYTTEDTVEINAHGGLLVTKRILDLVFRAGAVPAEPGEFTRRAFLGGRIDLSEAEAVMEIISAENDKALHAAVSRLRGRLAGQIRTLRSRLLDESAYLEAAMDDPEHYDISDYGGTLRLHIGSVLDEIRALIDHFDEGRVMTEGIRTVILGRPNAGKSSVMNMLIGHDRAIVTDIAGTTRDILEEKLLIRSSSGNISLIITDTAGIHETDDPVEKIGIDRAMKAAGDADLILYVCDSSVPLTDDDRRILALSEHTKMIILLNKSDLPAVLTEEGLREMGIGIPVLTISAKLETGKEELADLLSDMFFRGEIAQNDQLLITNRRHYESLKRAETSLESVLEAQSAGIPEDLITIDIMEAYRQLGYILGEEIDDDLADRIFEKFCMGK